MTPDNHPAVSGYRAGFVPPDIEKDLSHYDALPWAVKAALDDAPWSISAAAAYHHIRAHGLVSVLREIKESADAFYLAFERETGIPRPIKPIGKGMGSRMQRR